MASTGLLKQFGAGNRKTWTWSAWIKKSYIGGNVETLIAQEDGWNGNGDGGIFINGGYIATYNLLSGTDNGGNSRLQTSARFWDCNAWYHFLVRLDTTQSTENERLRIYVNGVQQTSFTFENYPALNFEPNFNRSTRNHGIGKQESGTAYAFEGSMSHVHFCDGYSYAPTEFGETDATTGEWKIKTSPSVSYGTTGFFILKDGNSVTDQSGNSNNFTVAGGTLTKTEDNPSNVFATINPLFVNDGGETNGLSNGNTRYYSNSVQSNQWNNMAMTLGASTGKYYWEVKYTQIHSTETVYGSSEGIASDLAPANHNLGEGSRSGYGYGWLCGNRNTTSNTRYLKTVAGTSTLTTDSNNTPVAVNDIVGVAFDADNGKLWFHKNGTYIDDLSGYIGNPSTGAYPYHTGIQTGQIYTPWSDVWQNSTGNDIRKEYNFGNGYFGTTAVSSAGTNASGIGIFEYDVPNGFTALSTKGLNL